MNAQITEAKAIEAFINGGNARFTVVSKKSGTRFTFEANKKSAKTDLVFVSVLNGPCNLNDYAYIGVITPQGEFKTTKASKAGHDAPSVKAIEWTMKAVKAGQVESFEFWHDGTCAACGRTLTDPESISTGFGPICRKRVGLSA
jgi:hypothetical protein